MQFYFSDNNTSFVTPFFFTIFSGVVVNKHFTVLVCNFVPLNLFRKYVDIYVLMTFAFQSVSYHNYKLYFNPISPNSNHHQIFIIGIIIFIESVKPIRHHTNCKTICLGVDHLTSEGGLGDFEKIYPASAYA